MPTRQHIVKGKVYVILCFLYFAFYTDIDECSEGTDKCEQSCYNTPGSYVCLCDGGFQLLPDKLSCQGAMQKVAASIYHLSVFSILPPSLSVLSFVCFC